jgi:hypothetical protein
MAERTCSYLYRPTCIPTGSTLSIALPLHPGWPNDYGDDRHTDSPKHILYLEMQVHFYSVLFYQ